MLVMLWLVIHGTVVVLVHPRHGRLLGIIAGHVTRFGKPCIAQMMFGLPLEWLETTAVAEPNAFEIRRTTWVRDYEESI